MQEYKLKTDYEVSATTYYCETLQTTYTGISGYYVNSTENYQEDCSIYGYNGSTTKFEIKRSNCYYLGEDGKPNKSFYPSTADYNTRFDTTIPSNCLEFSPTITPIPEYIKDKPIYYNLLDCTKNGYTKHKMCKAEKMINGDWGLGIIYRDGILWFPPKRFQQAILGNCYVYGRYTQNNNADYVSNNVFWQLRLMVDLSQGIFIKKQTPSEFFKY